MLKSSLLLMLQIFSPFGIDRQKGSLVLLIIMVTIITIGGISIIIITHICSFLILSLFFFLNFFLFVGHRIFAMRFDGTTRATARLHLDFFFFILFCCITFLGSRPSFYIERIFEDWSLTNIARRKLKM